MIESLEEEDIIVNKDSIGYMIVNTLILKPILKLQPSGMRSYFMLISLLLAYSVGEYRLLDYGKVPKSNLVKKLEAGDRDIYQEYISFRKYRGKVISSIERRKKRSFNFVQKSLSAVIRNKQKTAHTYFRSLQQPNRKRYTSNIGQS